MFPFLQINFSDILQVPGTRVTNSTPPCDAPIECPEPKCEEACPHGRQLNTEGCPTCYCKDPCAEAKCRDDETCELVAVECEVCISISEIPLAITLENR